MSRHASLICPQIRIATVPAPRLRLCPHRDIDCACTEASSVPASRHNLCPERGFICARIEEQTKTKLRRKLNLALAEDKIAPPAQKKSRLRIRKILITDSSGLIRVDFSDPAV